jgi:hypothetical protein
MNRGPRADTQAGPSPRGVEHDLSETGEPAWSILGLRKPRYSQSLERGLAILGCFTPKRPVLAIADIADDLGTSRSTTHRLVACERGVRA